MDAGFINMEIFLAWRKYFRQYLELPEFFLQYLIRKLSPDCSTRVCCIMYVHIIILGIFPDRFDQFFINIRYTGAAAGSWSSKSYNWWSNHTCSTDVDVCGSCRIN